MVDMHQRQVRETGLAKKIAEIVEPVIEDTGYQLVRVRLSGTEEGKILQIMAENKEDGTLGIDDCTEISRAVSPILEVEDPISGEYNLEVSSPGMARPLVRPVDYDRYSGFEAKIELSNMIDNRRRFRGKIEGFDEESNEARVFVELEGFSEPQLIGLDFNNIENARLVINDDLLKAGQEAQKQRNLQAEISDSEDGDQND